LYQPGILRTGENTLQVLKEQVNLACSGKEKAITKLQTETGVKDSYTQYWIEDILAQYSALQESGEWEQEIQRKLLEQVAAAKDRMFSPFLTCKGTLIHHIWCIVYKVLTIQKDWILLATHQLSFYTPFCLEL
jgi:hypothetical protein